ncbi:hypothetical protein B0A52_00978 [Exophiala mesophila]|uniref:SnoaL-like domain-containing protein n=1 Tax=Exophiala mesophila TaxID=212818 RepID=A0A438NIS5_EXOME|nr:hypothetical protein B0A52_00978 [Exophiala mesophila]
MGNNTADTQWPSATVVTEDKKELLDRYFSLLDINEPTSGEKIAQLYTEDGWLLGPAGLVKGREAIKASREHAWAVIKKRTHKLIRVYAFDTEANDLLIIGNAVQGLANEKTVSGEWVARICFEKSSTGDVQLKSHQVWADFGGGKKAIQEALGSS